MTPAVLSILRSPVGEPLSLDGDRLVTNGGRSFRFEDDVAFVYDEADVSPFLAADAPKFEQSHAAVPLELLTSPEFAKRTEIYQRARAVNTRFLTSFLRFSEPSSKKVAEIGVGACDVLRKLARSGAEAIAVDFFPWEMAQARREALAAGDADFSCVSSTMAKLPFADASLDLVYMHAALHHALPRDASTFEWSNPNNLVDCLSEIRRVLKRPEDGGCLLLLGEGIYPEDAKPEARVFERACEANPEEVYEAWYKVSEYEQAYAAAGIYPNLFLWQNSFRVEALAYTREGRRRDLVSDLDGIDEESYWRLSRKLAAVPGVFPKWISVAPIEGYGEVLGPGPLTTEVRTQGQTRLGDTGLREYTLAPAASGFILFGPYVSLVAGRYQATFALRVEGGVEAEDSGVVVLDTYSEKGALGAPVVLNVADLRGTEWKMVRIAFEAAELTSAVEVRVSVPAPISGTCGIVAAVAIDRLL